MPVFVFKCDKCEKIIEKVFLHKVDVSLDEEVSSFVELGCGCGGSIVKTTGVPSLRFVGKDFYTTEERARKERQRIANDARIAKDNIAKSE
jgi:predicted nucleic acid-binding Zn ribbon protein